MSNDETSDEERSLEGTALVCDSEEEWLRERKNLITASDAPCILGVGYKSPLELWLEKTGRLVPDPSPELKRRFAVGKTLEPLVAAEAEQELGVKLIDPGPWTLFYGYPEWRAATPDRLVVGAEKLVELKTIHPAAAAKWEGLDGPEPPLGYLAQVQHQLAVMGWTEGWLVGMVGLGERLIVVPIVADPDFQGELLEAEEGFRRFIQTDTPPPADGTESSAKALKALYWNPEPGKVVLLSPELLSVHDELIAIKERLRDLEGLRTAAENRIKEAIGDAEAGELAGAGVLYSWKLERRVIPPQPEEKVIETRVLRLKKRKGEEGRRG